MEMVPNFERQDLCLFYYHSGEDVSLIEQCLSRPPEWMLISTDGGPYTLIKGNSRIGILEAQYEFFWILKCARKFCHMEVQMAFNGLMKYTRNRIASAE
ncbi:hypothetical protein BSKO_09803 [Bryopsis sp. KO-2023]|nr:hypothetical protein BSKO_09803 [Bryopsis sp. KO-2023]